MICPTFQSPNPNKDTMANRDEEFERLLHLVRLGVTQRFGRDPIVVQAQGSKIKIEHPTEPGTFLSREYTPTELAQLNPAVLANGLLDAYADVQKRDNLVAYAKAKFPDAAGIRLLDGDFDKEIVGIVELKFLGARVRAGFTRELWDHTANWEELYAHTERHRWKETVNSASKQKALLGENGWVEWK